jgi:hypothetical protein
VSLNTTKQMFSTKITVLQMYAGCVSSLVLFLSLLLLRKEKKKEKGSDGEGEI